MPQENNNNQQVSDFNVQNDRLHVLIKEAISAIDNYRVQIQQVDTGLKNARASLQNVPGVRDAIIAIDQATQKNYNRGEQWTKVSQAEAMFFQEVGNAYMKLSQEISTLKPLQSNSDPRLKIGDGQQPRPNAQQGNFNKNNANNQNQQQK